MVDVKVFCRIKAEKRQLVYDVPEYLLKDKIVVFTSMTVACHACYGDDHPYPKQGSWISKNPFQFVLFYYTVMHIW